MSLISIIIPIYNVEEYLVRCIKSIINQTYKNLEIILVNDGSTDKSSIICDEFEKQDKRIRVIHKKNSGVSSARNTGIQIAKGKYLGFVDSDDWIEADMFEVMKNLIESNCSDIAVCSFSMIYHNHIVTSDNINNIKVMTNNELLKEVLNGSVQGFLWNKLFKKEVFDGIRVPENMDFCEDLYTVSKILLSTTKNIYTSRPLYNYVQHCSSATNDLNKNFDENGKLKNINALYTISDLYTGNNEIQAYISISMAQSTLYIYQRLIIEKYSEKSFKNQYSNIRINLKKYKRNYLLSDKIRLREKAKYITAIYAPYIFKIWLFVRNYTL